MRNSDCHRIFLISIVLVFVAMTLWPYSRDYENYLLLFNSINSFGDVIEEYKNNDFFIPFIFYITRNLDISLIIIATAALVLKLYFFRAISSLFWVVLLLYIARFFLLHDVTQIKISLASGMLATSYLLIYRSKYYSALLFIMMGALSHTSIVMYFPVIVLAAKCKKPREMLRWLLLTATSFAIALYNIEFKFLIDYFFSLNFTSDLYKINNYLNESSNNDAFIGSYVFLKAFLIIYVAYMHQLKKLSSIINEQTLRLAIILMFSVSLFFFYLNISYPLAARFSEIAAPFEAVFLANSIFMISNKASFFDTAGLLPRFIFFTLTMAIAILLFIPQLKLI